MPKVEDIRLFSRIAVLGSISAAAREMAIPHSVASDRLKRLESDLGCTLANRTTRKLSLTAEGRVFQEHALELLEKYETAVDSVGVRTSAPAGILRVTAPALFGRLYVSPEIPGFLDEFPNVRINLILSDRVMDYSAEGIDVALRIGELADSTRRARRIVECSRVVCGSSGYVRKFGAPQSVEDLANHKCIVLGTAADWRLKSETSESRIRVSGPLISNNGDVVCDAVVAGVGIALRAIWDIAPYLRDGRLVRLLNDYESDSKAVLSAVYPPGRYVSSIARAFADYINTRIQTTMQSIEELT